MYMYCNTNGWKIIIVLQCDNGNIITTADHQITMWSNLLLPVWMTLLQTAYDFGITCFVADFN